MVGSVGLVVGSVGLVVGSVAEGSVLSGTLTEGSVLSGTLAEGSVLSGTLTEGSVLSGTLTEGSVLSGTLTEGSVPFSTGAFAHPNRTPATISTANTAEKNFFKSSPSILMYSHPTNQQGYKLVSKKKKGNTRLNTPTSQG